MNFFSFNLLELLLQVKEWGMSDKVGRIALSDPSGRGPFMGLRMMRRQTAWGNKIMGTVEEEVERLVNNSYLIAKKILSENKELLEYLKNELMEREVVSAEEFQMMLVQFKARTIDYAIVGADRNRDQLPFQSMPASV